MFLLSKLNFVISPTFLSRLQTSLSLAEISRTSLWLEETKPLTFHNDAVMRKYFIRESIKVLERYGWWRWDQKRSDWLRLIQIEKGIDHLIISYVFPHHCLKVEGYLSPKLSQVSGWQWRIGGQKRNLALESHLQIPIINLVEEKIPEFCPLRYSLLMFNTKFTGALKTFQRSPHWGFTSISSVPEIILQILVIHPTDLHK